MEEPDRDLTRAEAAAYLRDKGRSTQVSTLAKYASDGRGPIFSKDEGRVNYKQSELDRWLTEGPTTGRPRKAGKSDDLATAITAFIPMAERAAAGQGTFADGVAFSGAVENLKRMLARRKRANGAD